MKGSLVLALTFFVALGTQTLAADGNPTRGQRVFGACAACHSLQTDRNMTGPSLADLWGRKAGKLTSFSRYSSALSSADFEWNDKTLDDWINDPQHLVPGNEMTFPGIKDAQQRADLLAFLKEATKKGRLPNGPAKRTDGQYGRNDGRWTSAQSEKALLGATSARDHLLQRHLHSHNCEWHVAKVLGTKSSLKNGCE